MRKLLMGRFASFIPEAGSTASVLLYGHSFRFFILRPLASGGELLELYIQKYLSRMMKGIYS